MARWSWSWLGAVLLWHGLLSGLIASDLSAEGKGTAMAEAALFEWTMTAKSAEGALPDITLFGDGRLRLGARLGGETSWHALSKGEFEDLTHFLFVEQRIMEIEGETLSLAVQAAAEQKQKALEGSGALFTAAPQLDAGTSVFRATQSGRRHEVRYYDLFGDAQLYAEVEELQRLRSIELRLLELVDTLTAR